MQFLCSNFPPVKTDNSTFADTFYNLLPHTERLDVAVGYITSDSLIELQKAVELNHVNQLNLIIGMHYIDRFTPIEYKTALKLNTFLKENNLGEVRLVTPFRFHGKMYVFHGADKVIAGIIGSNNLSSIVDNRSGVYETALLVQDDEALLKMNRLICDLSSKATDNIADLAITSFNDYNPVLEGQDYVERATAEEIISCKESLTEVRFEIPIKDTPQSNLNVFFGKGRETMSTGVIKPRHWYEVEIIVSKAIASHPDYPRAQSSSSTFNVLTDDGWKFKCKVSGDYSKNFRSEGDLRILGKWLKGRLENAGVLTGIQPVTKQTLAEYGRDTFSLIKTSIENLWYLDFGVAK